MLIRETAEDMNKSILDIEWGLAEDEVEEEE